MEEKASSWKRLYPRFARDFAESEILRKEDPIALIHEARMCIRRADALEAKAEENPIYLSFALLQRALARDKLLDATAFLDYVKPQSASIVSGEALKQGRKCLNDYEDSRRMTGTYDERKTAVEKLKRENPKLFADL